MVSTIRRYTENIIILGTPFYSQRVDEASRDPVSGTHLAYTIHFYAAADNHDTPLRSRVTTALANGVALFATEWGTCQEWGSGSLDFAETQIWLDLLAAYHISDANWAVSNKDETCSSLRSSATTIGGWSAADLTSSGTWVRNSIRSDANAGTVTTTTYTGTTTTLARTCSEQSFDCTSTQCCSDPSLRCYEKNQWFATCRSSCTPGVDPNDPPQWQTPWTCVVRGR
jgi:hypothetical protein